MGKRLSWGWLEKECSFAVGLFLVFEPVGDSFEERVGGHVDDGDDHFFSCFDDRLVFWHQCVADECPVDAFMFDEFFGGGFG